MTAQSLLEDLQARGITLRAEGDRLRFHPREVVGPQDLAALRAHKPELLALLRGAEEPQASPAVICPWCRSPDLLNGASGGLWCPGCNRLTWRETPAGGFIRADCGDVDPWPTQKARLLAGVEYPPRPPEAPPAGILADPVTICPKCNAARVLPELQAMTRGLCWPCGQAVATKGGKP